MRQQARAAGVSDILVQGSRIKFQPVELQDSKQVRLKRLYPGANYRAAAKALQVPLPRAAAGVNQPTLRDTELVQWVSDFLADMFGVDKKVVTASE